MTSSSSGLGHLNIYSRNIGSNPVLVTKHMNNTETGILLHTALRKVCDSKATSIVWNAINLVDNKIWNNYVQVLNSVIDVHGATVAVIKTATLVFWHDTPVSSASQIIKLGFDLFNENDWECYTYWVVEGQDENNIS